MNKYGYHIHNPYVAPGMVPHADTHIDGGTDEIVKALNPGAVLGAMRKIGRGIYWFCNHWRPSGMLVYSIGGSGGIAWVDSLQLFTGTTADSYAYAYKDVYGELPGLTWDKKRYLGVLASIDISPGNSWVISGLCPFKGPETTARHIGFKILDGTIYGTVADGAAESTLEIETLVGTATRRLECILDPGVECRFYVDGVDKGAITANLPSGTLNDEVLFRGNVHNTAAEDRRLHIHIVRFLQEE